MEYVLTELGKQLLRIAEIEATLANEEYENEVEESVVWKLSCSSCRAARMRITSLMHS